MSRWGIDGDRLRLDGSADPSCAIYFEFLTRGEKQGLG